MNVTAVINSDGISAPSIDSILDQIKSEYRRIFGDDLYLESDSMDGEFIGIIAQMLNESNQTAIQVYNGFSPQKAEGTHLSSVVKINGISRKQSSQSTVDVQLTGTVGTTIENGVVQDEDRNNWNLPSSVSIGENGTVTVTATADDKGAIEAQPNTITKIQTPTRGWQSVTNPYSADVGNDVEQDGALRQRQARSVMSASSSIIDGIVGSISELSDVTRLAVYENDDDQADDRGIPAHSISAVVQGGAASDIGQIIAIKKTPGTGTYGDTSIKVGTSVLDTTSINFYRPTEQPIQVAVDINAVSPRQVATSGSPATGYLDSIGDAIKQALVDYISNLGIGDTVYHFRFASNAILRDDRAQTYEVNSVQLSVKGGTLAENNVDIAFNELATLDLSDVDLTVHDDA